MNKYLVIVFIILSIIISISLPLIFNRQKKKKMDELSSYILKKDFECFFKECESPSSKRLIHPFNLEYMKLNCAQIQSNNSLIFQCLSNLEAMNLSDSQKISIYSNLIYYFISIKDKINSDKIMSKIETIKNYPSINMIKAFYDTYILKGSNYLDYALSLLNSLEDRKKPPIESLIISIYDNLGNKEKSDYYSSQLEKHLKIDK